uniref:Transcription factor like 5 n=2 Tax=Podarcis muralis TaxID=64176 RepID=A0A670I5B0_PODMU
MLLLLRSASLQGAPLPRSKPRRIQRRLLPSRHGLSPSCLRDRPAEADGARSFGSRTHHVPWLPTGLLERSSRIRVWPSSCPRLAASTRRDLVTLIRHPSEVMGVPLHQQQNKCTTLVKNKTAATTTTALQFTCPLFNPNVASPVTGNANPSQTQSSGASVLETAKHQDLGLPRAFSICYQQEIEATKQTVGPRNKALPEHVWIKLGGDAICKQTINKRSRSRIHPLDTNVQRKPLGDIQNVCDTQNAGPAHSTWQATQPTQSTQSGTQGGTSQRRERHNRMERDRR